MLPICTEWVLTKMYMLFNSAASSAHHPERRSSDGDEEGGDFGVW